MPEDAKYDQHYRDDPAACGAPFSEFESFCSSVAPGSVLDLGCGQGRDSLMFARAGHQVVGIDVSSVGITQLREAAEIEALDVHAVVSDVRFYKPDRRFDIVILDRVLHMLPADARREVLQMGMGAVEPGGHLLVAEGAKGMVTIRKIVEQSGWALMLAKPNRLISKRSEPFCDE